MSKKKKSSKTPLLIVVLVLVLLLLAGLCVVYFGLRYFHGRSDYVKDSDVKVFYDLLKGNQDEAEETLDPEVLETLGEEDAGAVKDAVSAAGNLRIAEDSAVYNILFIGADARGAGYGNSDAMLLISLNTDTKTLYMTSFMRDLYADIPGVGVRKLNAAYAVGGGPLLVETISSNYRIGINNYAAVNFSSLADIIDMMGGIDITITEEEVPHMNNYIEGNCSLRGLDPTPYYISGAGDHHLNGIQAVAFARIRYVARGSENYDYGRTSRQREVLTKLLAKAKQLDAASLLEVLNAVLPLVTHNIDTGTLSSLLMNAASYVNFEVVTQRIPYDGMFGHLGEQLVPDFEATAQKLHSTIYGY